MPGARREFDRSQEAIEAKVIELAALNGAMVLVHDAGLAVNEAALAW